MTESNMTQSTANAPSTSRIGNRTIDPARRTVACFTLIFGLAFVLRAIHLAQASEMPAFDTPVNDARAYVEWSKRIAAGDWIGREVFYQAPLYPYLLAVLRLAFGDNLILVRVVQISLGSAACGLIFIAGRRFWSQRIGLVAGLIAALYAPAIFFDVLIQKAVLDMFLMCLMLWLLARIKDEPTSKSVLFAGIVNGCFCLSRENVIVFVPLIAIWLAILKPAASLVKRSRLPAIYLAGVALILAPVGIRNYHVGGSLLLTTSQMGPNFFIGNHEGASGWYESLRPNRGDPAYERIDATDLAQEAAGRSLKPAEVSGFWMGKTWDWIRGHPGEWAGLLFRKCLWLVNAYEVPDADDFYDHASHCSLIRQLGRIMHFGVIAPLGLLGIALFWRRRREMWLLSALLAATGLSTVLFYIAARYRVPMIPILILFASAGVAELIRKIKGAGLVSLKTALPIAVCSAVIVNWPMIESSSSMSLSRCNAGAALILAGKYDAAITELNEAIRLNPKSTEALVNLANAYQRKGLLAESIDCLRRARALRPFDVELSLDLGNALAEHGELDEAEPLIRAALSISNRRPDVFSSLGVLLVKLRRWDEAIAMLRRGAKEMPDKLSILANLSWNLSTCQRDDLRDGAYALQLAQTCLEKTRFRDPQALDVLAAALAELGRFDDAVEAQTRAIALAQSRPALLAELTQRQKLYQSNKPYRRPE